MCQMVGYTRQELLKMNIIDILNAELLKANPLFYPTIKPGDPVTCERRAVRKDGKIIDIEINGKKFEDNSVLLMARDITARKEMEAELKKAELTFRTLADKSMVGIYILQREKFIYVNPRFAEVFGYGAHEIISFTDGVERLIHQDYRAIAVEHIRARLGGGVKSVHYEAMGIRKDGSTNWIEFYGSATILDDEPTIIGSMIDITERKLAEDELRASEQKYKMLFDSSPMPLLMVAKNDLSIIAANKEATNLYGYTNGELLKMTIRDMRHPEDRGKTWDDFRANIAASSERGIFRHVKKDGTNIMVQIIAHDILFEGKEVRLGLCNDLTEKIRADEALQKTEANLQTILNTTDTAYALLDRDLDLLEYNNKASIFANNQFNFDPEKGGKIFDRFPESRHLQFLEYIDNVFKGNTISYEIEYDQAEGGAKWYYVRMFPIANKQNEIIGLVLAITDITERKDAEQRLQLAYDHIKANNQFIREMLWKQSHILRRPLANLKGLITILTGEPGDKEALDYMEVEIEQMDKIFMEMAEGSSKI